MNINTKNQKHDYWGPTLKKNESYFSKKGLKRLEMKTLLVVSFFSHESKGFRDMLDKEYKINNRSGPISIKIEKIEYSLSDLDSEKIFMIASFLPYKDGVNKLSKTSKSINHSLKQYIIEHKDYNNAKFFSKETQALLKNNQGFFIEMAPETLFNGLAEEESLRLKSLNLKDDSQEKFLKTIKRSNEGMTLKRYLELRPLKNWNARIVCYIDKSGFSRNNIEYIKIAEKGITYL